MKRYFLTTVLFILYTITTFSQKKDYVVTIKTRFGDMVAILYDETPKHKENFIKLAKVHYYDSLLFHRVIEGFMIQGGDPESKNAKKGQRLGNGGPGYTIEAEFNPKLFHEKGALSAARLGDQVNPEKASSGSQFYIVQGKKYTDEELNQVEQRTQYEQKTQALRDILQMPAYATVMQQVMDRQRQGDVAWLNSFFEKSDTLIQKVKKDYKPFVLSTEQRTRYKEIGGAPHLDGNYTVFGKVIKGLEVIDKIAAQPKDAANRPVEDIRMTVSVKEMSKKQIEKLYGYSFAPEKIN